MYIKKDELGKMTGKLSRSRPVIKIDITGEIVDAYSSARAAGRENHMSYQTVIDRCKERSTEYAENKVRSTQQNDGSTII